MANGQPHPGTAMTPSTSTCCQPATNVTLERMRYFPRQLITPDDLTQEQQYLRAKLRRHNLMLHGWGVVCGCVVKAAQPDWTVCIEPGYVLGPYGDEILIEGVTVDLSSQGLDGNLAGGNAADPWCAGVRVDRKIGETLYIAVSYAECPSRPVRVQSMGCGCDGSECEYSRIRDSFCVQALDQLPTSHANMRAPDDPFACPRDCPPCVSEPWVVLAAVTLRDKKISDQDIDNYTYRRHVASYGNWWFTCQPPPPTPTPPPPPLLKVAAVRFFATGDGPDRFMDQVSDPSKTVFFSADWPNTIEVAFGNASVDFGTVLDGKSFIVTDNAGNRIPGTIVSLPSNTVRWTTKEFHGGRFKGTLVGDGADAIKSQQGVALDGDPTGLPSGNGVAGGSFVFDFDLFVVG